MERDVDFLLRVLSDGEERELDEILALSRAERGYGMTVHSRAADLRKRGYVVENRVERPEGARARSFYRLVGLEETPLGAGVSSSPGVDDSAAASSVERHPLRSGLARDAAEDLSVAPPGGPPDMEARQLGLLDELRAKHPELWEAA